MTAERWKPLTDLADANPNVMFGARAVADMLREATGWQPIETAPRDGTMVLIYTTRRVGVKAQRIVGPHVRQAYFAYGLWQMGDFSTCELPTHWMPLPPAPKEGEA